MKILLISGVLCALAIAPKLQAEAIVLPAETSLLLPGEPSIRLSEPHFLLTREDMEVSVTILEEKELLQRDYDTLSRHNNDLKIVAIIALILAISGPFLGFYLGTLVP